MTEAFDPDGIEQAVFVVGERYAVQAPLTRADG